MTTKTDAERIRAYLEHAKAYGPPTVAYTLALVVEHLLEGCEAWAKERPDDYGNVYIVSASKEIP